MLISWIILFGISPLFGLKVQDSGNLLCYVFLQVNAKQMCASPWDLVSSYLNQ